MDMLRQWAPLLCAVAMVGTMLYRLFPDNTLGKQGRQLLPCLFLCVALLPLSGRWGITLPDPPALIGEDQTARLTARARQQFAEQVDGILLEMVNQAMENYGMHAEKVTVDMDIREDGSIHMGQITVYVDGAASERTAMAEQIAEKRLGTPVTVARWRNPE